jgi:hypothetical protein
MGGVASAAGTHDRASNTLHRNVRVLLRIKFQFQSKAPMYVSLFFCFLFFVFFFFAGFRTVTHLNPIFSPHGPSQPKTLPRI